MHRIEAAACLLLSLALALPVSARVAVDFTNPESYTDAGDRGYGQRYRQGTLDELRAHLEQLGARYLPADQHLEVDILDIDLAGRFEPWRGNAYDVRIMRDITWPRIALRYTLRSGETVIADGEEAVVDMMYLRHPNRYFGSDRLRYEKQMLDDWFMKRFGTDETHPSS